MGKKIKTGKKRKDKFYKLAKETGYRARSAFKLLQLNRKYQFLQKSRVLIDLCAAPGGWLQVAANHMPMSSLIVGVDLVPIRAIPNVTTIQADITTEKCRQLLSKELMQWKADAVINDGAPNVGKNWLHDAFSQASLTLKALKLACDFLNKGGWFVTKVFRSKDYQPLMWVFTQLFRKVHATKPQASRSESAEIFVVCQGYTAPDKIDARFFDIQHIFKEVTTEAKPITMLNPEKQKKKTAEGYADGDYTLYHTKTVTEFLQCENPLDILSSCNELKLDNKGVANHELTTNEIKECFKDIKVLGKKDIRDLINWRKKMLKVLEEKAPTTDKSEDKSDKSESEDEDEAIAGELLKMKEDEKSEAKRKKKQLLKKKRKLRERLALKMDLPDDKPEFGTDESVFSLAKIKSKQQLSEVGKGDINFMDNDDKEDWSSEEELQFESDSDDDTADVDKYGNRIKTKQRDGDDGGSDDDDEKDDDDDDGESDDDDDDDEEEGAEDEEDIDEKEKNPLMVDLEDQGVKTARQTKMWFNKESFSGIEVDVDEDLEIEAMTKKYKEKGGMVLESSKKDKKKSKKTVTFDDSAISTDNKEEESDESDTDDTDSDDSDSDSDYDDIVMMNGVSRSGSQGQSATKRKQNGADADGFEVVPVQEPAKKIRKLSPEGLALGAMMVSSKKNKREILEHAYNRNAFNDKNLPDWFEDDESKHRKKQLPVTKEMVAEYRMRLQEINARPIKKVAEAKARKKRKTMKKLTKARKKAEEISDTLDMGDKEKAQQIKSLYKKAGLLNKKKKADTAYVVAKKGLSSKRMRRPGNVKGPYKVVDKRMKKEVRAKLKKDSRKKRRR